MTSSVSVAIMAHPKRSSFVPQLQARLDRPAKVVLDRRNDRWDTGRRAWLTVDRSASHGLVLQDDAVLPHHLVAGVEKALQHVPDGSLLSLYCGRSRPYRELVKQLVARAGDATSWLTMGQLHWGVGIVMPTKWIDDMISWCDKRPEIANYDRRISRWCQHQGLTVYYPWPSLVDHRDSPSLVPGRGSANRRAHRFIGADASVLAQRWDGAVVGIPALSLKDGPAPSQNGGRGPVRFASVRYPELHIPTIEVRFRKGFAEVTRRSAIAYLNSPWMRRRGVRLASEVEEQQQATPTPVVDVVAHPPQAAKGKRRAPAEAKRADSAPPVTADPAEGSPTLPSADGAVPDGTAAVVLVWVGTDRDRARQALEAEQARPKPRTVLVAKLEKIVEAA